MLSSKQAKTEFGLTRKSNTDQFIQRSRDRFGDRFTYEKTRYTNTRSKITITCPDHGHFSTIPSSFLKSETGCKACADTLRGKKNTLTTADFVSRARKRFGDKFTYEKSEYVNARTNVIITCPTHRVFESTPDNFLGAKFGCKKCGANESGLKKQLTTNDFLERARKCHGDRYDYSNVKYINSRIPVLITCTTHGAFRQNPQKHWNGEGCPKCG